jgi:multidrug resistance protein, MATE family
MLLRMLAARASPVILLSVPASAPTTNELTPAATLDWQPRPLRRLLALSWPVAVSMVSYALMTLVDTFYVGRLGAASLAGVGLGGTVAFALLCFPFGLLRGVKTLVAHAVGAGRRDRVRAYERAAVRVALAAGLAMIAVGQLAALAVPHLTATAGAGDAARAYLRWRNLAAPLTLLFGALREVRTGEGDARSPMIASLVANAANALLAPLFIFTLHRGAAGAGAACALAQSLEALLLLARMRRRRALSSLPSPSLKPSSLPSPSLPSSSSSSSLPYREVLRIGLPTALQLTLEVGSFAILTLLLSSLSDVQMAAHQVVLQVCQLSFLPAFAIAEAASVLAGQAAGARQPALVVRVARLALWAAAAYTACCSLVFAVAAPLIVGAFASAAALAIAARRLLRTAALFAVSDGANIVLRCVLRGVGDVRFAAVIGVLTAWLMTPPLAWLLGWKCGLGAVGGWLGLAGESTFGALILWRRLQSGRWQRAPMLPDAGAANDNARSDTRAA